MRIRSDVGKSRNRSGYRDTGYGERFQLIAIGGSKSTEYQRERSDILSMDIKPPTTMNAGDRHLNNV
jgi:hypothetical protein